MEISELKTLINSIVNCTDEEKKTKLVNELSEIELSSTTTSGKMYLDLIKRGVEISQNACARLMKEIDYGHIVFGTIDEAAKTNVTDDDETNWSFMQSMHELESELGMFESPEDKMRNEQERLMRNNKQGSNLDAQMAAFEKEIGIEQESEPVAEVKIDATDKMDKTSSQVKWFVASDIHGSYKYCKQMFDAFEKEKADKILLLGDLLYHGPRNDLPDGYDTKKTAELLNEHKNEILCVKGNCDADVDQMVLEFPIMAEYAIIDVGCTTVFVTHGDKFNESALPPMGGSKILLHGHTHVPKCEVHDDYICMNPGSVSIPKSDSWHGYMTIENGKFIWKDLEGSTRQSFEL